MKTFKLYAVALAAVVAVVQLAGCAGQPKSEPVVVEPAAPARPAASATPATPAKPARPAEPVRRTPEVEPAAPADAITGVTACDDYLASYLGCHRVIGTYEPDALQSRYDLLRNSLLNEARNPEKIPGLESRCTGLAAMMKDALNGRECAGNVLTENADAGFEEPGEPDDPDLEK